MKIWQKEAFSEIIEESWLLSRLFAEDVKSAGSAVDMQRADL